MNICESCLYEVTCQIVEFHKKDSGGNCYYHADKTILKTNEEITNEKRTKALESLNEYENKLNNALEKLNGVE